jgi:predicted DNA-binding protein
LWAAIAIRSSRLTGRRSEIDVVEGLRFGSRTRSARLQSTRSPESLLSQERRSSASFAKVGIGSAFLRIASRASTCGSCLAPGYDSGYTRAMKTAISLPDPLFEAAERLARQLGKSRSQLYAEALRAYLERHRDEDITARLNEIYDAEPELAELDPVLDALQYRSLPKEEW